jgi:hypothetical protein
VPGKRGTVFYLLDRCIHSAESLVTKNKDQGRAESTYSILRARDRIDVGKIPGYPTPSLTPLAGVLDGRGRETPRHRTALQENQTHRPGVQRRELRLFPERSS